MHQCSSVTFSRHLVTHLKLSRSRISLCGGAAAVRGQDAACLLSHDQQERCQASRHNAHDRLYLGQRHKAQAGAQRHTTWACTKLLYTCRGCPLELGPEGVAHIRFFAGHSQGYSSNSSNKETDLLHQAPGHPRKDTMKHSVMHTQAHDTRAARDGLRAEGGEEDAFNHAPQGTGSNEETLAGWVLPGHQVMNQGV